MENSPSENISTETTQPKKKGKGCLIVLITILVLVVLMIVGVYAGYRKVTGIFVAEDLGIQYTEQDYFDLLNELEMEVDPTKLCIDCPLPTFSDSKEISYTVSNQQASAAFEYVNQYLTVGKITGTQIRMGEDMAELTTNFSYQGKEYPIYMTGTIAKASENSISGEIYDIKVGGIPVPSSIVEYAQSLLLNAANEKISAAGDNVRIDDIQISKEGVSFEGLVPTKIQ